jgi:hypothetical protein
MGVYDPSEGSNKQNRILIETDSIALVLQQIGKWRNIKSTKSTIVLQVRPGNASYRLILGDSEPEKRQVSGWTQYDVGDYIPEMKAR